MRNAKTWRRDVSENHLAARDRIDEWQCMPAYWSRCCGPKGEKKGILKELRLLRLVNLLSWVMPVTLEKRST